MKIIIGVTGGIAAYKTLSLVRLLVKSGNEVKIVLTKSAHDFVTPLSFSVLSKNQVFSSLLSESNEWNNHIELSEWADILIIAPCTANTMAKFAHGFCDNLLSAIFLSFTKPIFLAPAMDRDMYLNPITQNNLKILNELGVNIIQPNEGELASGLEGMGRMAEPEQIFDIVLNDSLDKSLLGVKALVNAGPTYEAIDPVRYITNHSTGKMGYAIALNLARKGAKVFLVSGPTHLTINHPNIELIQVTSAEEMYNQCMKFFPQTNLSILSAAVADYKPKEISIKKIKKQSSDAILLELTKNPDILATLGNIKLHNQVLIGFSLETDNELENSKEKLKKKNCDFIVMNSLKNKNSGFGYNTNQVSILTKLGSVLDFPLMSKDEVAEVIVNHYITHYTK